MKEGYWISARTGQSWPVTDHGEDVKRPEFADAMGLPEATRAAIAPLNGNYGTSLDREKILIEVMKAGYIRFRGHGAQYTFEFWGDTNKNLWACYQFAKEWAGPFTYIVINNLKTNEQFASNFQEFEERMQADEQSVLRIATQLLKNPALLEAKTASGFPRLMMIMKGMVPQIHTFGIMSPDNPQGKQVSPEQNNIARAKLKNSLDHMGFGYVAHTGCYGTVEQSFFIMNIPPADMLILRENYDQQTVIIGEIEHREGGKSTTTFKMVDVYGVQAERIVVVDANTSGDNYYSEVKGRKFVIPFFDESYSTERLNTKGNEALEADEDEMESNVTNPFTADKIPENDKTLPHLATIKVNAQCTREDAKGERIGMGNYYKRKQVFAAMKALKLALND